MSHCETLDDHRVSKGIRYQRWSREKGKNAKGMSTSIVCLLKDTNTYQEVMPSCTENQSKTFSEELWLIKESSKILSSLCLFPCTWAMCCPHARCSVSLSPTANLNLLPKLAWNSHLFPLGSNFFFLLDHQEHKGILGI